MFCWLQNTNKFPQNALNVIIFFLKIYLLVEVRQEVVIASVKQASWFL
ncbi:unnamed protein product [Tenebrio molitor]|nr:unnamed protein product [Tenebrio molitor]